MRCKSDVMQKTLLDFCARKTGDRDETCSSGENSLDLESSDVSGQDTNSVVSEASVSCLGECCKPGRIDPNQPRNRDVLDATMKTIHAQKRSVSASWFDRYAWLTLCETRNALLCHYCVKAHRQRLLNFSTKGDDAFVRSGFSRWKNALECFAKHEASSTHREAMMKLQNVASVNIGAILDSKRKEQQLRRQEMLQKHLSSVRYLARQGLALRGHEESEGNMLQLLQMWSEHDSGIKEWLRDGKYLSHDIVNEQIKLMSDHVLREILSEVKNGMFFAVQADEATDIACNEQMCVSIRWVNKEYEIFEEPIGLVQLTKTDSTTIFKALKDVLIRCVLPTSMCRGQAYDGAANMSGRLHGVATRLKEEEPAALYVHCLAHSLNLCLQDASRSCNSVRDGLQLVMEIIKLIKFSPKRTTLFNTIKSQLSPETQNLKPLCPTRWTVRTGAISAILDNYEPLLSTLDEVHATGRDEYSMKAGGFVRQLQLFSTFFGLKLCILIFSPIEQLSCTLQSKDIIIQEARAAALITENFLRRQRTDSAFEEFYSAVISASQNLTDEPVLPRPRKLPRRIDDGAASHQPSTPKEIYRQKYFEALDIVCEEIKRRFDQEDLKVVIDIEQLLLDSANGITRTIPESIKNIYRSDLDIERLSVHLQMLPDAVKQYSDPSGVPIKKVTSIRSLCNVLNVANIKQLLSQVNILLQIFLTVPITTATSERTFSTPRRLKTYLRSTMAQDRLNHLLLLYCHKARTDAIDLSKIASAFVSVNDRRRHYFGSM